ncbi:hypothetical protein NPX13_g537 [Xylaria arbuscula]|uniref:FAD-binding domain-containing protein n=1 Tax=Xylaria arbuscula TaxID=114810 RepID=A0A9W8TRZ4_9PEZI|nr:hypothetical protein NPX13_g537 [Xylaria arbuscula]
MVQNESLIDVLVVGAGPVGLITAYQLARFGGVSVRIIEKHSKSVQDAYGRAITLFPRTSEMLDQLDLADDLLQEAFACRETVAYNCRGEEVHGRGWSFMDQMKDTAFDFSLVLRQKYQEEIFRKALRRYGVEIEAPVELIAIEIDNTASSFSHSITATIRDADKGLLKIVKCKRLIGADGGRSSVRRLVAIPFEGSTSEDRWVRIDGHVKTNLPKPRTYCSIESPTHGNVLWVGLDRGATRIGYAFTDDRANAFAEFNEQAAIAEAIAAVKPFTLEFERVDWWTIYTVGQRVAKNFSVDDRVFLVGDACHTHSSGAAQGLNTGIHDSVNLSWKLSLVLRGLAVPTLVNTYEAERRPNVLKLIQYDMAISRLMTNRLPEGWQGDSTADVNDVLGQVMEEAGTFSSGLSIAYESTIDNPLVSNTLSSGPVNPGMRAPDIALLKPGTFERTRLIRETTNVGSFYAVFFAADCSQGDPMVEWRSVQQSKQLIADVQNRSITYLTILPTKAPLIRGSLGRAYFDVEGQAGYKRYGIDLARGGVIVIRPDGWILDIVSAESDIVYELETMFEGILRYTVLD